MTLAGAGHDVVAVVGGREPGATASFTSWQGRPPASSYATPSWSVAIGGDLGAVGTDPASGVVVTVHGEVLGAERDPARLAARVARLGIGAVQDLVGSHALLVVDPTRDEIALVTDRSGSRRLFAAAGDGATRVSSSLAQHGTGAHPDPVGVGWFLANGAVHGGRTTLEGVEVLRRGAVHRAVAGGLVATSYAGGPAATARSDLGEPALSARLAEVLVDAVADHVDGGDEVALALSGGYDARALAGILRFDLGREGVRCFTYVRGAARRHRDEDLAARIAALVDYRHDLVQGYGGDFAASIAENARLGEGMRHFVHEVDAWKALPGVLGVGRPLVLAGDESFGTAGAAVLATPEDCLRSVRINAFDVAARLGPHLAPDTHRVMAEGVAADRGRLVAEAPATAAPLDLRDHLYQSHRLPNVILPWRERYGGTFATIRNPYLHPAVLDLMATVPPHLRQERALFRRTTAAMHPLLHTLPKAKTSNYMVDLRAESVRHEVALRSLIDRPSSVFDDLLPPVVAHGLLDAIVADAGSARSWRSRARSVARDLLPTGTSRALYKRTGPRPPARLDEATLLVRILLLRGAFPSS